MCVGKGVLGKVRCMVGSMDSWGYGGARGMYGVHSWSTGRGMMYGQLWCNRGQLLP